MEVKDRAHALGTSALASALGLQNPVAGGKSYRKERFGSLMGKFLYAFRLVDTDNLQRLHWDINTWTDEEVKSWKEAHLASCNAIAVAVRQLSKTALECSLTCV